MSEHLKKIQLISAGIQTLKELASGENDLLTDLAERLEERADNLKNIEETIKKMAEKIEELENEVYYEEVIKK